MTCDWSTFMKRTQMENTMTSARPSGADRGSPRALLMAAAALAAGCASVAPMAVKWGADLIASASQNYSQQYSNQLEKLLVSVYTEKANKRLGAQNPGAAPQVAGAYPQTPYPSQSPYPSDPYGSSSGSPYPTQDPYAQAPSQAPSPYPQAASAQGYGYPQASAIALDASILAQRASERAARRTDPVPIQDGEVLRDGGSDPRKGDVVKFSFRANCDCYVYVIGVDATGYVARIFPDPASRQSNPVRANEQYVVPEGTAWYGLDQYKGTEQVFFIASRQPRQDIEGSLTQLAQTARSSVSRNYRPVREPAQPSPASRGLVRVQMPQNVVRNESGQPFSFTPLAFATPAGADDITVTRWFKHE
jgi:uncharacterized protein DUF4384